MAILDPDGKLASIYTDSIIVIGPARSMPQAGERLAGTSIVLLGDAEEKAVLADWLRSQDLGTAAKSLGCSVSTVQRLRDALHITIPYTGASRTTKWRHTRTNTPGQAVQPGKLEQGDRDEEIEGNLGRRGD